MLAGLAWCFLDFTSCLLALAKANQKGDSPKSEASFHCDFGRDSQGAIMCSICERFYPDVAMQFLISENAESSVFFRPEFRPRPKSEYDWNSECSSTCFQMRLLQALNVFVKILPEIHLIVCSIEANPIFSRTVFGYR